MCLTTSLRAEFHTTWQGEPAARSPLHPHRQPSPASSHRLPDARRGRQGKARGMAGDGATYGRCITSQAERSCSSRHPPCPRGEFSLPWTPSPNRPPIGCRQFLEIRAFAPRTATKGAFALPSIPSSRGVPAPCHPCRSAELGSLPRYGIMIK